jgi:hypothetical protein
MIATHHGKKHISAVHISKNIVCRRYKVLLWDNFTHISSGDINTSLTLRGIILKYSVTAKEVK